MFGLRFLAVRYILFELGIEGIILNASQTNTMRTCNLMKTKFSIKQDHSTNRQWRYFTDCYLIGIFPFNGFASWIYGFTKNYKAFPSYFWRAYFPFLVHWKKNMFWQEDIDKSFHFFELILFYTKSLQEKTTSLQHLKKINHTASQIQKEPSSYIKYLISGSPLFNFP